MSPGKHQRRRKMQFVKALSVMPYSLNRYATVNII